MSLSMAKQTRSKKNNYLTVEVLQETLKGYVTIERFDNAMASIALSFERADNRLTQLADAIMNQFQEIRAENREFRKTMADHAIYISRHERKIDDITERVEVIEKKVA